MAGSGDSPAANDVRRWVARVTALLERRFGQPDPWQPEEDPLEVLLRTILSQNTNDLLRDRAYDRLRERFPTDEVLQAAPVRSIASAIRVCGLHRQKAQRIKRVLRWAQERFGTLSLQALCPLPVEEAFAALASVNGVGPKTAAVVLLFGCGRDIFPVDTHCHRTIRRLGFLAGETPSPSGCGRPLRKSDVGPGLPPRSHPGPQAGAHRVGSRPGGSREQTFRAMQPLVPKGKALSLHLNLIQLGRTICRAPRPRCYACPLVAECRFPDKVMEPLPPSPRPSPTAGAREAGG
jgi:endonuclease-3